eukprot:11416002-Alexandrium_andersonii.AAC.1
MCCCPRGAGRVPPTLPGRQRHRQIGLSLSLDSPGRPSLLSAASNGAEAGLGHPAQNSLRLQNAGLCGTMQL